MLRELKTGLVIVFLASSVIISNILRSTRSDKSQLLAKNVSANTNVTGERDNPPTPPPESKESNFKPTEVKVASISSSL
jgi:hypothetical protein